jgi:DNA-binding transcriptional regulator YiaG
MTDRPRSREWAHIGDALQLRLQGDEAAFAEMPEPELHAARVLLPYFQAARSLSSEAASAAIPALEDDPVALGLGLVPGPKDVLSPMRLRSARKEARLKIGEVASALRSRGWEVTSQTIFDWEQKPVQVAPAILNAVARIVGTSADAVREPRVSVADGPKAQFDDPEVVTELRAWAAERGRTLAAVEKDLTDTLTGAAARNRTTLDQTLVLKVIEILRLLDASESDSR